MGSGPPPPTPPVLPDGDEQVAAGGTVNTVGIDTDAITALNAAIGGVELLGQVVAHIQDAITQVGMARFQGINDLAAFTENLKALLFLAADDYFENTLTPRLDQMAAEAIIRALEANSRLKEWIDSFLDTIRLGS